MIKESDLYLPVKALLVSLGYAVKAEINSCDVVALKKADDQADLSVIVELKLSFSLELLLQGVNRQSFCDNVYLAILAPNTPVKRKRWRAKQNANLKLCRRLGLGLMMVDLDEKQQYSVSILLDPAPYKPRKNTHKHSMLIKEFNNRQGDPNIGGINKTTIVTAYRQNAISCAQLLSLHPQLRLQEIKAQTAVDNVAAILQKNHYGWFERVSRGVYSLTTRGRSELDTLQAQVSEKSKSSISS